MKKFFALSLALALTFSSTVCAAETVVPTKDFTRIDTLSTGAEKAITEYTSNAVAEMDGVRDLPAIASASNLFTEGKETSTEQGSFCWRHNAGSCRAFRSWCKSCRRSGCSHR